MKRIVPVLLAVVMVAGMAGCGGDEKPTSGIVYATENSDGTTPPPMPDPAPATPATPPPESNPLDSQEVAIAKCLSAKGAVLYGASWCPYTQSQIASFKDGFQYLQYVECTEQDALCDASGISAYPTWIIDGSSTQGYRAPTEIGALAGCTW